MIIVKVSYQNEDEKQRVLRPLKESLKNIKIGKEHIKKGHKNLYIYAE